MASGEQLFDSIGADQSSMVTSDKAGLIEGQKMSNGARVETESLPLHQGKTTNSLLHNPQNHGLRVIIISSIVFAIAVTVALVLTIYLEPRQVHGHAAVSCDDARCSEIGLQLLRDGGNAVDAAVGAAFCQGVVDPGHSGLGGGGFALVHDHKFMDSYAYDFSEASPDTLTSQELSAASNKVKNILSTGVPGQLKGLATMHKKHGELSWKQVVAPAIELARGFTVSESLEKDMASQLDVRDVENVPLGQVVLRAGQLKTKGDNMSLPGMVETLMAVQADRDALYSGKLRRQFVQQVRNLGGKISDADMQNYTVDTPNVLVSTFNDLTVVGLPPPSAGAIVGLLINIVAALGWGGGHVKYGEAMMYHQLLEALKHGYAHRGLLGDTNYNHTVTEAVKSFLSDDYAADIAEKIKSDNKTNADPSFYGPVIPSSAGGTTHISVIDSSELMVSLSTTLKTEFGNLNLLPSGIVLNSGMADFDLSATTEGANSLQPGRRPQSNMAPTVLFNSDHPCNHRLIVGAAGGSRIASGIVQTIINNFLYKQDVTEAVQAPRVHDENSGQTFYESELPEDIVSALTSMGHTLMKAPEGLGVVQAIEKTNDDLEAAADPRRQGQAADY